MKHVLSPFNQFLITLDVKPQGGRLGSRRPDFLTISSPIGHRTVAILGLKGHNIEQYQDDAAG